MIALVAFLRALVLAVAALGPTAPVEMRPAPTHREVVGVASWFSVGRGLYAAMPGYRDGTRVLARVTAGGRSVVVRVITQCGCPNGRVIDLSPEAFRAFAPLSRGIVKVSVAVIR